MHWALSPSIEVLHNKVDNCDKGVKILQELAQSCIMFLQQVQNTKAALEKHLEEEEKIRAKEEERLRKQEERPADLVT